MTDPIQSLTRTEIDNIRKNEIDGMSPAVVKYGVTEKSSMGGSLWSVQIAMHG